MSAPGSHWRFNNVRSYVGSWGPKRKCCERHQFDAPDPNVWSGRAVQEASSTWLMRSCINVSGLWLERVVLRATMDISAHASSLPDRPRSGHLGHQCSHAPGRPILHRVSSSRRPRRVNLSYVIDCCSLLMFLCLCLAVVPSSRPTIVNRVARRSGQGRPSRYPHGLALPLPGRALTAPSTARGSSRSGRCLSRLDALEGSSFMEDRPGDAGELVGERDRQHVVVQSLFGRLDPGLQAIALPPV
jgi:hypothetical protein